MKHFIHTVLPWNIYIFSPTYHADDSTIPIRDYMESMYKKYPDKFKTPQESININDDSEQPDTEIFINNYPSVRVDIIAELC